MMGFFNINSVRFKELDQPTTNSLFVCGLGFEYRASYIASQLSLNDCEKICIKLVKDDYNTSELAEFERLKFSIVDLDKFSINFKERDNIYIDYSVMMKSLYAGFIKELSASIGPNTNVYFMYCHGKFEKYISRSNVVSRYEPLLLTDDKEEQPDISHSKLLISLGFQRLTAVNIIEELEINYKDTIVFINKNKDTLEFYEECKSVNKELLELLEPKNIIEIDFFNFPQTISVLDSIMFNLKVQGHSVIVCPLSVKTFTVISMFLSLNYSNTCFYNASSGSAKGKYKLYPNKAIDPIVYQVKFMRNVNSIV